MAKRSTKRLTTEEFISKSKLVHGDKYNYSLVNYINNKIKVTIICPDHGKFYKNPKDHLNKSGCSKCYDSRRWKNRKKSLEEFVSNAMLLHKSKYDYSKFIYINCMTKGIIICPKHGEFHQSPNSHLKESGCPKCSISKGEQKISNWLI